LSGHLFQGRYKAVVIDPEERSYFATVSDYIHLNPVRAHLVDLDGRLIDYRWSSYPLYAGCAGRPDWFEPRTVLGELGLADDVAGRRRYTERMRQRAETELADAKTAGHDELRRGWCLGQESFRERMLRLMDAAGEKFCRQRDVDGAVRRSHGEAEARRLLEAGLQWLGLTVRELEGLPRGDARKLALARVIRERTAVPNAWIARELSLGHVSRVSRCWVNRGEGDDLTNRLRLNLSK
jgi:hypothetical protein